LEYRAVVQLRLHKSIYFLNLLYIHSSSFV